MKRVALIRHLSASGCHLLREGSRHSIWVNADESERQAIPRHGEIKDNLARHICRRPGIPDPPG